MTSMRTGWWALGLALAPAAWSATGLQYGDWVLVDTRAADKTVYAYTEATDTGHTLAVMCAAGDLTLRFIPDDASKKSADIHLKISFDGKNWTGVPANLQIDAIHLREMMSSQVFRATWTLDGQTLTTALSLKGAREAALPVLRACGVAL